MELDEYAKEGIDGTQIDYEDNGEVLEMIMGKPEGLLSLCDEEAKVINCSHICCPIACSRYQKVMTSQ